MCGITGIINKDGAFIEMESLKSRNDLIAHRGPDGEGFFIEKNVGFGHRRLAIIDLSKDGHQPMAYQDRYVITYNGEIYNYIEIKETLAAKGYQFKSRSDTEVILAAYDFWKEDCVQQFNGMWAFAIFDRQENIIFCSRDRFGIKPFYYKETDDQFSFGSEIKQLISQNGPNKVHEDLIAHYLFTGMHDHDERTFFVGVNKLPPSHSLIFDLNTNKKTIKRFYTIEDSTASNYEEVLTNAVKLRLRSDVKVGTCLSGGIDSSVIASIASKMYEKESGQKFQAIHAQSIEKAIDESEYAQEVASIANIDMTIIAPTAEDFKSVIEEVIYTQEEPFAGPSVYLQYFVMKKAKELNCKVMLDGQGGDETLLGYERYFAPVFFNYFKQKGLWASFREIGASKKNNSKMGILNILKYLLGTFFIGMRVRFIQFQMPWFKKNKIPSRYSYFEKIKHNALNLKKLQEFELLETNLQALLRYEDKNSMRHGIETRLPFIDYNSVESALSLKLEEKISNGWTKFELRRICEKNINKRIAWRKNKLGFNAPDQSWLKDLIPEIKEEIEKSKILNQFINTKRIKSFPLSSSWRITWRLYNLAVWEKIYHSQLDFE